MADKFRLDLITPTRVLLEEEEVEETVLPGTEGEIGVMAGHDPLMICLTTGIMGVRRGQTTDLFFVDGGYVEVTFDRVIVLAELAERPEEIDVERARTARERAEERLGPPAATEDLDVARAEAALKRALYRLQLAEGAK
jgi:F-type H+-transporting ATPase subunit epsilon